MALPRHPRIDHVRPLLQHVPALLQLQDTPADARADRADGNHEFRSTSNNLCDGSAADVRAAVEHDLVVAYLVHGGEVPDRRRLYELPRVSQGRGPVFPPVRPGKDALERVTLELLDLPPVELDAPGVVNDHSSPPGKYCV